MKPNQINLKQITDLNIKCKTIKLEDKQENIQVTLGIAMTVLDTTLNMIHEENNGYAGCYQN